jgi:hypothetical protein
MHTSHTNSSIKINQNQSTNKSIHQSINQSIDLSPNDPTTWAQGDSSVQHSVFTSLEAGVAQQILRSGELGMRRQLGLWQKRHEVIISNMQTVVL